jgi:molybdenum cofactor synthesis domain-containing protein
MTETANPTACIVVVGNEILSGRTQDVNVKFLATHLAELGIALREVRIIPDIEATIIATVNEVRAAFDHVFTTGGIGPTHDDITSQCIAAAFGVPWEPHPEAWAKMKRHYKPGEFNAARQRMATMPRGARLIENAISIAPGFSIGNVHVMAGVPRIMQAMFESLAPTLPGGKPIRARAVHGRRLLEGRLADGLAAIQARYPGLDIGSYPYYRGDDNNGVAIVAKGTDEAQAEAAIAEVSALIESLGVTPIPGEPPI